MRTYRGMSVHFSNASERDQCGILVWVEVMAPGRNSVRHRWRPTSQAQVEAT